MDRSDRPPDRPGPRPSPWSSDDLRARLDRLPPNHPSSPAYRPGAPARPRDAPRQADERPERIRRWYAPHVVRERDIEVQRRDQAPSTTPERWRKDWYWQRHGEIPAPFREEVAERIPDVSRRTMARLDRRDGGYGLPLESGSRTGLVDALEQRVGRLPDGFT